MHKKIPPVAAARAVKSHIFWLLVNPVLVWMYARLAKSEEAEALAGFGEAYERYKRDTPAFFPRVGRKR